jgi:hypothetical protein
MFLFGSLAFAVFVSGTFEAEIRVDQKTLPHQKVELYGFKDGEERIRKEASTDVRGHVRFEVESKEEIAVALRTVFENVAYYSSVFSTAFLPKTPLVLNVYRTAPSHKDVAISDLRFFVGTLSEGIKVDEEIVIENSSPFTIVGDIATAKEDSGPEVFRFSLPSGAFDLRFNSGFDEKETRFEGNDIIVTRPLLPGTSRFNFSYAIETKGTSLPIHQTFSLPIDNLSFGTDARTLKITGLNLASIGEKVVSDKTTYLYETKISHQKELNFEIQGLPLHLKLVQILPFVGFLVLLLIGFFLLKSSKSTTAPSSTEKNDLLQELSFLLKLKSEKLISEMEFQRRRLQLIENLAPFYSEKAKI